MLQEARASSPPGPRLGYPCSLGYPGAQATDASSPWSPSAAWVPSLQDLSPRLPLLSRDAAALRPLWPPLLLLFYHTLKHPPLLGWLSSPLTFLGDSISLHANHPPNSTTNPSTVGGGRRAPLIPDAPTEGHHHPRQPSSPPRSVHFPLCCHDLRAGVGACPAAPAS